jgi:hypothetical protein
VAEEVRIKNCLKNMITEEERIEIEGDLEKGFNSFYHFSLDLVEKLDSQNGHLKFAVVNMQIALELFLKFYFVKLKELDIVLIKKNGKIKYRDFSIVLNAYYSKVRDEKYAKKKSLQAILTSRNEIVHRGKYDEWNEELASYIINCAFFIQGVLRKEFDRTLLNPEYWSHSLSKNLTWKEGAENFAKKVSSEFSKIPYECPHCLANALIKKEIFDFDDIGSFENYQCLSCLVEIDTEDSGKLIECCQCNEKAYFIDLLNIQERQEHIGGCFNCGNKMTVRCCGGCDSYYFPDMIQTEIKKDNKFYCNEDCE